MNRTLRLISIALVVLLYLVWRAPNGWALTKKKVAAKVAPRPTPRPKGQTVGQVLKLIQSDNRGQKVQLTKYKSLLPQAQEVLKAAPATENLRSVKPPRSEDIFRADGDKDEVEFEKITDQSIRELYKITQRQRTSPNRGELWLRLAELYVEKARMVEYRKRDEYDKAIAEYEAKKRLSKPVVDLSIAQEYNKKAIQLYEWFLRDYPKDKKIDQALFFLGYNYFEIGDQRKGTFYYQRLTKEFPQSPYVAESHFALGEHFFDLSKWKDALGNYEAVLKNRRSRLYTFALYKAAWCEYRIGQIDLAMRNLERVVVYSREKGAVDNVSGRRAVNKIRLASEALKDLIVFYAESKVAKDAEEYFTRVGGEKVLYPTMEKLAYRYSDTGRRNEARFIFKWLLDKRPTAPKAFDYQYQIVTNFSSGGDQKVFREELYNWINDYGPDSEWAKANQNDKELLTKAYDQRESTLRNYTLQLHKTAQTNRAEFSQALAANSYALYTKTFPDSKAIAEMRFFYGELLYDMSKYNDAAVQYLWVADHAPKTKYHENSIVNALLALEKGLPSEEELAKRTGKSLEPVPFGPAETRFEAAAKKYVTMFPKGARVVDVKFKLGRLHYSYNHFDEALAIFKDIVQNHSKTKNALYSANLILDIYNLRKDYDGITTAATEMMANEGLKSQGFGEATREILERASFKKAQEAEVGKKYQESAVAYESFAKVHGHSNLATSAMFNSAINYERSGQTLDAIRMYSAVLVTHDKESNDLRTKSRTLLARLYEQTAQYEKAAREFENIAKDAPKDPKTLDLYYNAALIRTGLQSYTSAIKDYEEYFNRSKKRERAEVLFSIAEIQEKRGAVSLAIGYYKRYIDANPPNLEHIVEAHYKVASLSEKMGRKSETKDWFGKTVAVQARLARKQTSVGAWYGAQAKFKLTLPILDEFKAIRIPANPKGAEAAVQAKLKLIGRLSTELQNVIKYDSGDQIVGALTVLGQAYEQMFKAIQNSPVPKDLKPDEAETYRKELTKVSDPFKKQAIDNYTAALDRAAQLRVVSDWTPQALRGMQTFDPVGFVDNGEIAISADVPDYMGLEK